MCQIITNYNMIECVPRNFKTLKLFLEPFGDSVSDCPVDTIITSVQEKDDVDELGEEHKLVMGKWFTSVSTGKTQFDDANLKDGNNSLQCCTYNVIYPSYYFIAHVGVGNKCP